MLCGLLLPLATGCVNNQQVPDVQVYKEIPFVDAPEAVYVWTASHKEGLLTAEDYKAKRPYMIMIDPDGWATIKENWLAACLTAGPQCNEKVLSLDSMVRKLDGIASGMIPH